MIHTVGHSTTPWPEFMSILQGIDLLIDVRSHPSSRWEQFTQLALQQALQQRYLWLPGLGGWRQEHAGLGPQFAPHGVDLQAYANGSFPKQRIAAKLVADEGPSWTNVGLRDYSFFMTLPEFLLEADRLIQLGQQQDVAIMCCEATWWRCHRSMISDYLCWRGVDSIHLTGRNTKTLGVRVSRQYHSRVLQNRLQRYESTILQAWVQWELQQGRCIPDLDVCRLEWGQMDEPT